MIIQKMVARGYRFGLYQGACNHQQAEKQPWDSAKQRGFHFFFHECVNLSSSSLSTFHFLYNASEISYFFRYQSSHLLRILGANFQQHFLYIFMCDYPNNRWITIFKRGEITLFFRIGNSKTYFY